MFLPRVKLEDPVTYTRRKVIKAISWELTGQSSSFALKGLIFVNEGITILDSMLGCENTSVLARVGIIRLVRLTLRRTDLRD